MSGHSKPRRKRSSKSTKPASEFVRSTTPELPTPRTPEQDSSSRKIRTQVDKTREYENGPTSSKYPKPDVASTMFAQNVKSVYPRANPDAQMDLILNSEELVEAVRHACEKKRAAKTVVTAQVAIRGDTDVSGESSSSDESSHDESSGSDESEDQEPEPDTLGNKPAFSTRILKDSGSEIVLKNPDHRRNPNMVYSKRDFETSLSIAHKHLRLSDADLAKSNLDASYKFMLDAVVVFFDKTTTEEELEERYSSFREYGPKNTNIRQVTKGQFKEYSSVWYHSISESPSGNTPGYVAKATRDLAVFAGCSHNLDAVNTAIHQKLRKLGGKKYRELEIQSQRDKAKDGYAPCICLR